MDDVGVSQADMPAMQITTFGAATPAPTYQIVRVNTGSRLTVEGLSPLHLAPGEFVICSTHMRSIWTIDHRYTTSAIHVHERVFRRYFPRPDRLIGRRLECSRHFQEVLIRIMDAGIATAGTLGFPKIGRPLIDSFLQILALLPEPAASAESPMHGSEGLRRHQIKDYIRGNFSNPELSINSVAQHFGLTPRYVQKLFAAEKVRPGEYLRQCRLDASSRMLASREFAQRCITQVAFDCGFGSSAHFSNEFRRHFGVSPREYRKKQ